MNVPIADSIPKTQYGLNCVKYFTKNNCIKVKLELYSFQLKSKKKPLLNLF